MSASTWGNPNATKRVLLLHGLTSTSQFWHHIGVEFASRDYYVVAPDLLGHGNARRGSDYSLAGLVDELRPFYTTAEDNDHPYDIVIGHSLGAIVASALFPLLKSTQPIRVVLADPPLELSPEQTSLHRTAMHSWLENPSPLEDIQAAFPTYTKEDAIFRWLSVRLCDVATVDAVFDQNAPWSFSHLLSTIPENVKVTLLAADPAKGGLVKEEELSAFPRVTLKTVWGASHVIPIDDPQAVIGAALE